MKVFLTILLIMGFLQTRAGGADSLLPVRGGYELASNGRTGYRLFSRLASISAKLKLYPLAMRCYFKAMECKARAGEGAGIRVGGGAGNGMGDDLPGDDSIPDGHFLGLEDAKDSLWTSRPVRIADILAAFDDGKEAKSYAVLVQVKQPAPGKRKAFTHINNVGHMFITLIKYNTDTSTVVRSFGFYPHKMNIFSATPMHPKAPSDVKDDRWHLWDEAVGKFVTADRFGRILGVLKSFDGKMYDLNNNNCTDFGLTLASQAGISIRETCGRWPFGKGNNPANAGQSMLEGKYSDADVNNDLAFFSYIKSL